MRRLDGVVPLRTAVLRPSREARPGPERGDLLVPPGPPPAVASLDLHVFEFSLATAPLAELEEVSEIVTPRWIAVAFEQSVGIEEVAIVRTCHRVEVVLLSADAEAVVACRRRLPGPTARWRDHSGRDAVLHLHRVAAGLESLAPGEREVRTQVRRACRSIRSRHPRPVLRDLLTAAVAAADTLDVPGRGVRSIATVATTCLLDEVARPFPRVVVVGAGVVGCQLAESLAPYARVTLVYRNTPPPEAFLRTTGARATRIDHLGEELPHCDAVITAAKSAGRILEPTTLKNRAAGLVLIDLGVPRNIDPRVGDLPDVRLVDLEELHRRRVVGTDTADLEGRVARLSLESALRIEHSMHAPWIDAIMRVAEGTRRSEQLRARPYLGSLSPAQEAAIDHLTRRLVSQLLGGPVERLRALPSGDREDGLREFALRLFRPLVDHP